MDKNGHGWLSAKEVAAYLGCSEKTVYRRALELGGVKLAGRKGSHWRFKADEIDRRLREG